MRKIILLSRFEDHRLFICVEWYKIDTSKRKYIDKFYRKDGPCISKYYEDDQEFHWCKKT